MKRILFVCLLLNTLCFIACNDDIKKEEESSDDEKYMNDYLAFQLLDHICIIDTLDDNTCTYKEIFGIPDAIDPSIIYIKSTDDNDALSFFEYAVPIGEDSKIIVDGNSRSYTIDSLGTIRYTYIGSSNEVAKITLDIDKIPNIKEYIYVPENAWPYNDQQSPFRLGSIYDRDVIISGTTVKWRYLCVKECCGNNDKGILITFSGGWNTKKIGDVKNCITNCASEWAVKKLEDLMTMKPNLFAKAKEKGAIPSYNANIVVGGETTKGYFFYTLHTIKWVYLTDNRMEFKSFTWKSPWETMSKYLSFPTGSSSLEFGLTKPNGTWKLVSY